MGLETSTVFSCSATFSIFGAVEFGLRNSHRGLGVMARNNTAIVEKRCQGYDPKPDPPPSPSETILETPIPSANTSGTVTGPVVTAPQSQARPITGFKISLK